jgi:hypothetical protein
MELTMNHSTQLSLATGNHVALSAEYRADHEDNGTLMAVHEIVDSNRNWGILVAPIAIIGDVARPDFTNARWVDASDLISTYDAQFGGI